MKIKVLNIGTAPGNSSELTLHPELLAAVGARFSRSEDGFEEIMGRIDVTDPNAVESVMKFSSYGHRSLLGMVPIPIVLEGISMIAAHFVFQHCPTASGQEKSTRYAKFSEDGALNFDEFFAEDGKGRSTLSEKDYTEHVKRSFGSYFAALEFWEKLIEENPNSLRIPVEIIRSERPKDVLLVERMRRNFAFDRARYFLPNSTRTNVFLLQSAAGHSDLVAKLLSHPYPEFRRIGESLESKLKPLFPNSFSHARETPEIVEYFRSFLSLRCVFEAKRKRNGQKFEEFPEEGVHLETYPILGGNVNFADSLEHRTNRYHPVGSALSRTGVRMSVGSIPFAEIRDLGRHRTGYREMFPVPTGSYFAPEEVEKTDFVGRRENKEKRIQELSSAFSPTAFGGIYSLENYGRNYLIDPYFRNLGTTYPFEILTTADKWVYMAELRTSLGAHFRYAEIMKEAVNCLYELHPELKGKLLTGDHEPEWNAKFQSKAANLDR